MLSPVAVALAVVLLGLVVRSVLRTPIVHGPGVAVMPGYRPLLGHVRLDFPGRRNIGAYFHGAFRQHNLRMALVYIFWMPRLVVEDHEFIKHVLVTHASRYQKPVKFFTGYKEAKSTLGDGLLLAGGMLWKEHRRVCNPAFSLQHLRRLVPMFAEQTEVRALGMCCAARD